MNTNMNNTNMNNCVAYPEHCHYILAVNTLSLISCVYAIYRKHYHLSIVPGGVFLTSINFWKNPRYDCWERYLDISYVIIALIYQSYYAYYAQYGFYYFLITFIGILSFIVGKIISNLIQDRNMYLNTNDRKYLSCISILFHSGVHILGNIANIILYSGKII